MFYLRKMTLAVVYVVGWKGEASSDISLHVDTILVCITQCSWTDLSLNPLPISAFVYFKFYHSDISPGYGE